VWFVLLPYNRCCSALNICRVMCVCVSLICRLSFLIFMLLYYTIKVVFENYYIYNGSVVLGLITFL
jgi:hypothetical protein